MEIKMKERIRMMNFNEYEETRGVPKRKKVLSTFFQADDD